MDWEKKFIEIFQGQELNLSDGSHDLGHFQRVAATAQEIARLEESPADRLVILAAAYFHDIVCLPKNHPDAAQSSRLSAKKAREILIQLQFPLEKIDGVCHAIEAHSFSAKIDPQTIESRIIQDADRMEALGALGIMRTFYVSGRMGSKPYHPTDLMGEHRKLDDRLFALDHFECKLFKLPSLLQTHGGKLLAKKRADFLHRFVQELIGELREKDQRGALFLVSVCYEMGAKGGKLFSLQDPFATNRSLDVEKFALDCLLDRKDEHFSFLGELLDQLRVDFIHLSGSTYAIF